jgi:hypothetical protein
MWENVAEKSYRQALVSSPSVPGEVVRRQDGPDGDDGKVEHGDYTLG